MTDFSSSESGANGQIIVLDSPDAPHRGNEFRAVFIGLAVLVVIGGIAIGRLISSFGAPDASIHAMPDYTEIYVNIDLRVFLDSHIDRIADTFPELFNEPDEAEQEVFDNVSEPIQENMSLDFDEDIRPWLARSVGFGLWNIGDFVDYSLEPSSASIREEDQLTFLLAIANRDPEGAAVTLVKLANEEGGVEVDTIRGNQVFRFQADDPLSIDRPVRAGVFSNLYVVVSGKLGLMSNSRHGLETALAIQAGEQPSLVDNQTYRTTLALLPNGPGSVFAYGSLAILESYTEATSRMFNELMGADPYDAPLAEDLGVFALSFDINDEGLRVDVAQHLPTGAFDPLEVGAMTFISPDRLTTRIPANSLGHMAYEVSAEASFYEMVESAYSTTLQDQLDTANFAQTLADLDTELNLRSGTLRDLLESIDPGMAIYVEDTAMTTEIPVDMTGLVLLNNPATARRAIDDIVTVSNDGFAARTEYGWALDGGVHGGVVDDVLFITSGDVPTVAEMSITETELHRAMSDVLAVASIWGYIDLGRSYDYVIAQPDSGVFESDVAAYRPLIAFGVGGEFTDVSAVFSMVLLIDWADPQD